MLEVGSSAAIKPRDLTSGKFREKAIKAFQVGCIGGFHHWGKRTLNRLSRVDDRGFGKGKSDLARATDELRVDIVLSYERGGSEDNNAEE